ncbi:BPSS1780 family membrane protein [Thiohalorhabdus methylotrophus]|uniref:BPSS1780 family membrane protein n=1 Tax=Thiohalorhabdus methylotrophus TaxID=3242694 RepID=A0ABV4TQ93_9GAMM
MEPQRIGIGRAFSWFGAGWRNFRAQPAQWIALILLYVVLLLVLNLVPVLGGLLGTVLTPALGAGLLLGAQSGARGDPVRLDHLFAGLTDSRTRLPLLLLGGLALATTFLLAALYLSMADALPAPGAPAHEAPFALESGLGGLLVLVLGLVAVLAFYFAAPLVVFAALGIPAALGTSLRAAARNLLPIALFGLVYALLAVPAAIPFGLGFLVLGPVGIAATYAAFTEIFPGPPGTEAGHSA